MFDKPIFERREPDSDGLGVVLAPLIDIVFLLLIFFMVSTTFTMQPGLSVKLPRSGGESEMPSEHWLLTLTGEQELYLNREQTSREQLFTILSEDPRPVVFRADQSVPHGVVVTVLDQVRNAGIDAVDISTRPLEQR